MKTKTKQTVFAVAFPLAIGALSALLTRSGFREFESLNKPPLTPPGWLFPVVWTLLYILMGTASLLVFRSGKPGESIRSALYIYLLQLGVNFLWPIIFFSLGMYLFAFFWLVLLWFLVLANLTNFYSLCRSAGLLLVPYLIWVSFAGYLNLGVYLLN